MRKPTALVAGCLMFLVFGCAPKQQEIPDEATAETPMTNELPVTEAAAGEATTDSAASETTKPAVSDDASNDPKPETP